MCVCACVCVCARVVHVLCVRANVWILRSQAQGGAGAALRAQLRASEDRYEACRRELDVANKEIQSVRAVWCRVVWCGVVWCGGAA